MSKKIFIIGAGPAGLTAAFELLKLDKSYDVTILESSNHIGGISRTIKYKENRMDIGGHRFFSKNTDIIKWWNSFLPLQGLPSIDDKLLNRSKQLSPNGLDPEKVDKVMLLRNRISRIYYKKHFFDYPLTLKPSTLLNMGFFTTLHAGISYLLSSIMPKKEVNLENFYINRFGKTLYKMFFEGYTEKLWGRHPKEISANWGSQRVKGLSILKLISNMLYKLFSFKHQNVETSLIEEFLYPKLGPGQLWENVADEIIKLGGKIFFSSNVDGIYSENNIVTKLTYTNNQQKFTVHPNIVISSMPLKDLINSWHSNNLLKPVRNIANGLPYRDFITIGILVEKLKLSNKTSIKTLNNLIPDCWIYVQDERVKLGRIQIFNNWSPYMVENFQDKVWLGLEYFCNENDDFWNMDTDSCIKKAVSELVNIGIVEEKDVLDYHLEKVLKAYPAYFDTYEKLPEVISFINNHQNIYCIGRNGQHRYNNMDHSMLTAFEAVKVITNQSTDKQAIWNVNTESEYHESK